MQAKWRDTLMRCHGQHETPLGGVSLASRFLDFVHAKTRAQEFDGILCTVRNQY